MKLLNVSIIFKNGSEFTVSNALSCKYDFESYRYRYPAYYLKEVVFNGSVIVDIKEHVFPLDIIDYVEVY